MCLLAAVMTLKFTSDGSLSSSYDGFSCYVHSHPKYEIAFDESVDISITEYDSYDRIGWFVTSTREGSNIELSCTSFDTEYAGDYLTMVDFELYTDLFVDSSAWSLAGVTVFEHSGIITIHLFRSVM